MLYRIYIGLKIMQIESTCKYLKHFESMPLLFFVCSLQIYFGPLLHDFLLESRNGHSPAILIHCQGNSWIKLQLFSIRKEQTEFRHPPGGNKLTIMAENMMFNQRCSSNTHHCSLSPFVHRSLNIRVLCATPLNIQFSTVEETFCLPSLIVVRLFPFVLLYGPCLYIKLQCIVRF